MVLKTIQELNEYIEATGVVYNHSNTKLISRKSKVKRSRREAFLSLLPYRRLSSHYHHAENKPFTKQKSKSKPIVESATSKTRQKLQVSVRSQLPHGSKTLDFEVDPDTSISSLKELIHRRIGVLPQRQHLHIGNVPLLDFLTLHENGVDKKEIISLSTDDLTPDGPKVTCQPRDEVKRTQPQKPDETRSEKEQSGATPQEEDKVGKTQADDGATPQEEEKVGKTQADGEDKPLTIWCMKGNLQIFVQYPVLHGQKILCLQLHKEIAVSSLKELIHKRIGVKPKLQHLHIRRNTHNFQLQDLLTLNDCGVQQDQTILLRLSTDGLLGGGPTGELPDETLRGMSEKIPAQKLMKLGIELDFRRSEITKIDGTKRCPADKFFELLIRWRNKQPGDVNQTEALCKALKEVGETRLADDLADLKCSTSDVQSQDIYKKEEMRDPNDVAKQDTNKKQTDGNRVNPPSDSQETPRQGEQQSTRSETQHSSVKSSSQHKRTAQEQDSQQGTSSKRARQGEAGKLDDSSLYSLSEQISARTWTKLAIKLGFCHAEVTHFEADLPSDVVRRIFDMLVKWRKQQPGDTNQKEALCKALKEVGETRLADNLAGGASLQSHQPSGDMSENQPSTSQTPECSTSYVQSQAAAAKCKGALKKHYITTGSYVRLNPFVDEHKRHISKTYVRSWLEKVQEEEKVMPRLKSRQSKSKPVKEELDSYEDIFVLKTETDELTEIAVFSGLAGVGKTILFVKIAHDWATGCSQVLQKYELVFLLKLCYLEQASDLIDAVFDQLLAEDTIKSIEKDDLRSYIETDAGKKKVLILLDGFDELKTTSLSKSSFGSILKILNRKLYRGCTVLVSTRPSHFHRLVTKKLVQEPFMHVRVLGFNKERVTEYVEKCYSDGPDKAKGLLERIESSDNLSTLAESPMLLLLMYLLWREDSTLPETMTGLYQRAIKYIAKRKDVSKEEMSRVVIALGQVSLRGLLSPDQEPTFQESDFEQSVFDTALKVGIVNIPKVLKSLEPQCIVEFFHKTFQEFAAVAYLQSMFETDTQEFHNTLNEIMSKGLLAFEYLLRFCCGDNEACTLEILKVFQERCRRKLSFDNKVGQLALHCYFEGQCKCLPPEEFIHSFLTDHIAIRNLNNDSGNSVRYFVQRIAKETRDSGRAYLAHVKKVIISSEYVHVSHIVEAFSGLPNLVTLELSDCRLGGTAVSWGKQLRHSKALQELDLSWCSLNGQDMVHVAELLGGLPNLRALSTSWNDLGGTAALWCKQLGQCKALQHLNLSGCSLNEQDVVHVAESLSGLPDLFTLNFSGSDLGGTAESLCKQLGQCKALQDLDLSGCKLNGQDMVHVAELLRGLPNLAILSLSCSNLGGTAALWCKQLGQRKALQDLDLSVCKLNGQDMVHVAESLCGLPNLFALNFSGSDLGGTAALWCKQLGQCKELQDLDLSDCKLNGQDMVHVAESLTGLPNLVRLDLSFNILGGTAALWCKQLGQCKALQDLKLSDCKLNGQDTVHVVELLRGLPNLVRLNLSGTDLGGTAESLCKQLGQCKALQHLDLSDCSLNGQDMVHVVESLCGLPNLVRLNLFENDVASKAALFCAELKKFKALEYLTLGDLEVTEEEKRHINELLVETNINVN